LTRFFLRLLAFSLLFILGLHQIALAASNKYAAVVVDSSTGRVLHAENAHERRHPASLTKKMTLYLIFEALRSKKISLKTQFPVSTLATKQIRLNLGLKKGSLIDVESCIRALVIHSANDVAVVVAEGLSGSLSNFVQLMNKKAKELGMKSTKFFNASGVPDRRQITTAMDMAILGQAVHRDFPEYYHYFQIKSFNYLGKSYRSHNHMLGKVAGLDGIKTGFVNASGFNISTSAVRYDSENKPRRLFAVVMGGESWRSRDKRAAHLIETSFQKIGAKAGKGPKAPPIPGVKGLPAKEGKNGNDPALEFTQEDTSLLETSLQEADPMPAPENLQTVSYAPPPPPVSYTEVPEQQPLCQAQCPMPAPQVTTMPSHHYPSQQMMDYLESVKACPVPEKPTVTEVSTPVKKVKKALQPLPSPQKKANINPAQLVSGKKALPSQWVVPKAPAYKESSLSPVKKVSYTKKKAKIKIKKAPVKKARSHRRRAV